MIRERIVIVRKIRIVDDNREQERIPEPIQLGLVQPKHPTWMPRVIQNNDQEEDSEEYSGMINNDDDQR